MQQSVSIFRRAGNGRDIMTGYRALRNILPLDG